MNKIAILGATSHIAKGLIYLYSSSKEYDLFLFARSIDRIKSFLTEIGVDGHENIHLCGFDCLKDNKYDAIINCIGTGDPAKLINEGADIFFLNEAFDNMVLNYLGDHTEALYIYFSSGAVYGTDFDKPADENNRLRLKINDYEQSNNYGMVKLYSECKHRSLKNFNIVDIRVFGYYSRFIDLETKFLLSEMVSCIIRGKIFTTSGTDIIRDYAHPLDIKQIIDKCLNIGKINKSFDIFSLKPAAKSEIIDLFVHEYGLEYKVDNNTAFSNATGLKANYYSISKQAVGIGYAPGYSSMDCIKEETEILLGRRGSCF